MPKTVYTLRDVIELIAKQEKEDPENVQVANNFHEISIGNGMYGEEVELDDPLFEIERA
jgi:hypothetical protein